MAYMSCRDMYNSSLLEKAFIVTKLTVESEETGSEAKTTAPKRLRSTENTNCRRVYFVKKNSER